MLFPAMIMLCPEIYELGEVFCVRHGSMDSRTIFCCLVKHEVLGSMEDAARRICKEHYDLEGNTGILCIG